MALVNLKVDPDLEKAIHTFKESESQRCLVISIKAEVMVLELGGPTAKTSDLGDDLAGVRKDIAGKMDVTKCCFIIVRLGEGKRGFGMVMYIPEGTKPKDKMMYASSALNLRDRCNLGISGEKRLEKLDDLTPKLFNEETEEQRNEIKTEKEKVNEEISKMEVVAGGGPIALGCAIHPDLKAEFGRFKEKQLKALVASLEGGVVKLAGQVPEGTVNADVSKRVVGADTNPRYVVTHWDDDKIVFVYICPPSAKPKEKMPYASTKPSFMKALENEGINVTKAIEIAESKDFETSVNNHLKDLASGYADIKKDEESKAKEGGEGEGEKKAPAKMFMQKGHRMLI